MNCGLQNTRPYRTPTPRQWNNFSPGGAARLVRNSFAEPNLHKSMSVHHLVQAIQ
jgi:hypothetical protein